MLNKNTEENRGRGSRSGKGKVKKNIGKKMRERKPMQKLGSSATWSNRSGCAELGTIMSGFSNWNLNSTSYLWMCTRKRKDYGRIWNSNSNLKCGNLRARGRVLEERRPKRWSVKPKIIVNLKVDYFIVKNLQNQHMHKLVVLLLLKIRCNIIKIETIKTHTIVNILFVYCKHRWTKTYH